MTVIIRTAKDGAHRHVEVTGDLDAEEYVAASCPTTCRLRFHRRRRVTAPSLPFGVVAFSLITPLAFQFGDAITRAIVPTLSAFDRSPFRLPPLALAPIWLLGLHSPQHSKYGAPRVAALFPLLPGRQGPVPTKKNPRAARSHPPG